MIVSVRFKEMTIKKTTAHNKNNATPFKGIHLMYNQIWKSGIKNADAKSR